MLPIYARCDKDLQIIANNVIIGTYLTYGKGDNHDCYGRICFTRGGRTEGAPTCRYRQAVVAYWRNAWLQDRQSVAHQTLRTERVVTGAQEQESRGKVNLGSATPRLMPACFPAPSINLYYGIAYLLTILSARDRHCQVPPCAFFIEVSCYE